jgi:aminoglycoside phosphotransferase (APT) family kinase protein
MVQRFSCFIGFVLMLERCEESVFLHKDVQVNQNWSSLRLHLRLAGHELDLTHDPQQFSAGFGNLNYYIILDGKPAVLRRPPMGPLVQGANDMLREGRILLSLSDVFPLAPNCLFLEQSTKTIGAPFLIMEYRPGIVIGPNLPEQWKGKCNIPEKLTTLLIEILTKLHAIEPDKVGLGGLGKPEGYLARTGRGWFKRAQMAWPMALPDLVNDIMFWLEDNIIIEQSTALLHNDFKLDNIILDPRTLEPQALIDWDLGTCGDPLWDLAVLLSYWTELDDPSAMLNLNQMPTKSPGFLGREDIIKIYGEKTGRDMSNIRYYRVLAQFRLAVVFRQIYNRYKESGERNSQVRNFDRLSLGLLDFTMEVANGSFD